MAKSFDLLDIRNHLFDKSEDLWTISLLLAFSAQILAILTIVIDDKVFQNIAIIFVLLTPIGISWFRKFSDEYKEEGDKCRRLILYSEGLGQEVSPHDLSEVRSYVVGKNDIKEASYIKPYFHSSKLPGATKLADITSESCFFTSVIAKQMAKLFAILLFTSFILLLAVLYGLMISMTDSTPKDKIVTTIKAIAVTISFLLSCDILFLWIRFKRLAVKTMEISKDCDALASNTDVSLSSVLQLVEDYHVNLIVNPPLSRFIYRTLNTDLNTIYRESHNKK